MTPSIDLDMPRAHGGPAVRGVLRGQPEDFVVDEELGFALDGTGEHLFCQVRKTGANTAWVAEQLARAAGVRPFDVGYAGRKDRHAITTQWFSIWLPGGEDPALAMPAASGVEILGRERHSKKLRRGMHAGNRFRVTLRSMERLADPAPVADAIAARGVPNYFGEQRFGHGGGNLDAADALLSGSRRADRKKDLYLSAARSHLFNLGLAQRVETGTWDEPEAAGWLPGKQRKPACDYVVESGFEPWYEGLERFGVKAMRRRLAVLPADFKVSMEGDALVVSFGLPSGSYATAVLRELADYSVAAGVNVEDEALG